MKTNFLKFLTIIWAVSVGFSCQAQISRSTTEYKIDSLLPVNTTKQITPIRLQTAFRKVLDYVQPSNFTNQSITLSKLAPSGATTGQIIKWNGTSWIADTDNAGAGTPTWGSITGTLSSQPDLNTALAAKANATHSHPATDISQSGAAINQVLKWNGTAWTPSADATGGSPTWGTITGTLSTQSDLNTAFAAKENSISIGTTSQYWRGDKTFQTLDKAAVGLSNVDNTSDANKPISTAVTTALAAKANATHSHTATDISQSGAAVNQVLKWNGTAWTPSADATGGSPTWGTITGTLSTQSDLITAFSEKESSISAGTTAQYWRGDKTWQTLEKAAVGLGNVDNTSDANKPISTATQTAIDGKLSYHTIAQLRAFIAADVTAKPRVFMTDSGKEGEWYYDASDAASADNTGTTIVTASGARYKRVVVGPYKPEWFGGMPNDAINDHAAIQACINLGTTYIRKGTYLIGANLVPVSNRIIYGDGAASIIKINADNLKAFYVYQSGTPLKNITIRDLQIDGGGQTTSITAGFRFGYGIYVSNATDIFIEGVYINKCGVTHPTTPMSDNTYGGYGIVAEARSGVLSNIHINNCKITNIAGGGNIMGDGIYVAGYSSNMLNVPTNIYVTNCSVENVGRHCFTVAGEHPESWGENIVFQNCNGKNAALSGIDLEEGNYVRFENVTLENCGNYTGYFNPQAVYGANYRLCAGIAYGNESEHNLFRNIKIKKSYLGVTLSAGDFNTFDQITVDSSTVNDIQVGNARFGENLTISNSKFLTPSLVGVNWYNGIANSGFLLENCVFLSPVKFGGVKVATVKNCEFRQEVTFQSSDNGDIIFSQCRFLDPDNGLYFNNFNTLTDKITVKDCAFIGNAIGISAVWTSLKNARIDNCTFTGNTTAGIYHANADNGSPFASITNCVFDGAASGIHVTQAFKYADISNNKFLNITGWCIKNTTIISGTSTSDVIISGNKALSSCVNGVQIEVQTGSHDYNIISRNNMRACIGTKSSISAGNTNGFQTENFF